jgi:hypothetical protein
MRLLFPISEQIDLVLRTIVIEDTLMNLPLHTSAPLLQRMTLAARCLCLLVSIPVGSTLWGASYYISPSGDNANDGHFATPWATITHGLEQAQPADTLFLRGGTYYEQVTTVRDGADQRPIVLMSYGSEIPYIDGVNDDFRNGVVIGNSYITLVGVKVRNWDDSGIWLQPGIHHIIVRRCEVYDCGSGIDIYEGVHDFVIDSVDLHRFAEESHGLDMTSHDNTPIYNGLVSNSRSYDGGGGNCDGFALGHRGDSNVYTSFRDIRDVRLVNCEVYNVGDGFDISGERNVLERCIAHDTYYGGNYKLWGNSVTLINCIGYNGGVNVELDHYIPINPDDPPGTPPPHATLYNCTFFNGTNYNISIETDSCRLRMYNCIVVGGDNIGINFNQPFVRGVYEGDYNLFGCGNPFRMVADPVIDLSLDDFRAGNWTTLSGADSHSGVIDNPLTLFIDTSAATINLRLRAGAEAINAGVTMSGNTPTIDFDGLPRTEPIDIGAFEYQGPSGVERSGDDGANRFRYVIEQRQSGLQARFTTSGRERVQLVLIDMRGRSFQIVDKIFEAGEQAVDIPTADLAAGVYLLSLMCDGVQRTCKVVVMQ